MPKGRPKLEASGELVTIDCDDVLMAIGQENAFPWIERDVGMTFNEWGQPAVDRKTFMSSVPGIFFGGDAAWGPENIIWAVAHGHQAAISIDAYCNGKSLVERPKPGHTLVSQKMGIHEWSYSNNYDPRKREAVPHAEARGLAQEPETRGGARLRRQDRRARGRTLPQLRCADRVHREPVHRVRRVHGHLPGRLHQLHRERRRGGPAQGAARAGAEPDAGHLRVGRR